jgi:hypothetical protein
MSISHWGFFPGYWIAAQPTYSSCVRLGSVLAEWKPCHFDEVA